MATKQPKKPATKKSAKQPEAAAVTATGIKKDALIAAYCEVGCMTDAAKAVGISRRNHSYWMKADEDYRQKFAEAKAEAMELLEDDAIRRARGRVTRPVRYEGHVVGHERIYSDALMMFLLRGGMPEKYGRAATTEVTGAGGGPVQHAITVTFVRPGENA